MPAMATKTAPAFDVVADWERLPAGVSHRDVTGVAVDLQDRVYLFVRFPHRVLVYERDGSFVRSWGNDVFTMAHGLTIGPDDRVYCVDNGDHSIRVFSLEGEPIMTLGVPGQASDTGYDPKPPYEVHACECIAYPGGPFNRCCNLAVAPSGELYVADGYGNCRVHRFSAAGDLIQSWGEIGTGPGEFHLPHGIGCDAAGRVLVCDRENDRIQVFTADGDYLSNGPMFNGRATSPSTTTVSSMSPSCGGPRARRASSLAKCSGIIPAASRCSAPRARSWIAGGARPSTVTGRAISSRRTVSRSIAMATSMSPKCPTASRSAPAGSQRNRATTRSRNSCAEHRLATPI